MAKVRPRKWTKGQVFDRSDLPPVLPPLRPHMGSTSSPPWVTPDAYTPNPIWFQGDDVIPMSLKALREIFRHFSPTELPPDLAACLAGDTRAIAANNDAGRRWELENERRRLADHGQDTQATHEQATIDPLHTSLMTVTSQQTNVDSPHAMAHGPGTNNSIVHRTELGTSRGKRMHTDPAAQVCTLHSSVELGSGAVYREPSELFPELQTPPLRPRRRIKRRGQAGIIKPKKKKRVPAPSTYTPPRTRSRVNKNKKGQVNINIEDFFDVPLQQAEATEILGLIGAAHITIPSHLVFSQQSGPALETGQSSKGPHSKKNKHVGPLTVEEATGTDEESERDDYSHGATDQQMDDIAQQDGPFLNESLDDDEAHQLDSTIHTGLEDIEEDLYLDQVDYSDDDPLP